MAALPAKGQELVGFWEPESVWYRCHFLRLRETDQSCKVRWEDGSISFLSRDQIRPIGKKRKLEDETSDDVKRTKITGLEVSMPKSLPSAPSPGFRSLPPHRFVMAPMVGGSELPFRMLARRYGVQLCYTPMIYSGPFSESKTYRESPLESGFQTCAEDRPLVAHFCGNDPEVLLKAAKHVANCVDAVDLNLGCPQRIAHAEHFGAYLLDPKDRTLVCSIVKRLSEALPVPVFCKIRLLDELEDTLQLVRQLQAFGASLIAVHARYRGTPTHRRDGPAHLDQVTVIKKILQVPVLANGNVRSWDDVVANLNLTGADGVMSAEGMLDDPCLFAGAMSSASTEASSNSQELRKLERKLAKIDALKQKQGDGATLTEEELEKVKQRKTLRQEHRHLLASLESAPSIGEVPKDGLTKARLYLAEVQKYPPAPPLSTLLFHCRRMAKPELSAFQLLEDFVSSKSLEELEQVLSKAEKFQKNPKSFKVDEDKEQRARELRAQQAYESECRRKYEQRMARKAQRLRTSLAEVLKASAVPGGTLSFGAEPSWLLEKGDTVTDAQGGRKKAQRWQR